MTGASHRRGRDPGAKGAAARAIGDRRHASTVLLLLAALGATLAEASPAAARDWDPARLDERKPEATKESLSAGLALYALWCAPCHGRTGAGDGPAAAQLWPRPRDFSLGLFKFRSTGSGELPTDGDLFRSIARGVPGTSMPAWGEGRRPLSDAEIWQLVAAVKSLVPYVDWRSPDFDPYREEARVAIGQPPAVTDALVATGREVYEDEKRGGCVRCHGAAGRGDGKGPDASLHDDWGDPILPADLTDPQRYRNGTSVAEIARTFSTGLNGTSMPSYADSLSPGDRWAVAAYSASLQEPDRSGEVLLLARLAREAPPLDPGDPFWARLPEIEIPLTGQALTAPRHENPTVSRVWLRAAAGGGRLAVWLAWNDRTGTTGGTAAAAPGPSEAWLSARRLWDGSGRGPDGIAVQMPGRAFKPPSRPHFYRGGPSGGVVLWAWSAGGDVAREQDSSGWSVPPRDQPGEGQQLEWRSHFADGRRTLVFSRPLRTVDADRDFQIAPGMKVPIAVQAWDGGTGESACACAVSSWYWLQVAAPVPVQGWIAGASAAGAGLALSLVVAGRARRQRGAA